MSEADGFKLRKDMENVWEDVKYVLEKHHEALKLLQEANIKIVNSSEIAFNRTMKIETSLLILKMNDELIELENKVKSIYRVMVNKRIDNDLISESLFQRHLADIETTLDGTSKELPFRNVREYFNKLEVRHRVTESILVLEMEVPIVEKGLKDLFKIHYVPIRIESMLALIDTHWSFLANDSNSISTFVDLKSCYEDSTATHLCEMESPIYSLETDNDWLVKSFRHGKIDLENCMSILHMTKFSQLTFIKFGDGKYFYFTLNMDTIQISCDEKVENVTLVNHSGILSMQPGCSAVSKDVKLLASSRIEESHYWNHNVLNITFDLEKFKKTVEMISTLPDTHVQLYENINELNNVWSYAKDPADISIKSATLEVSTLIS